MIINVGDKSYRLAYPFRKFDVKIFGLNGYMEIDTGAVKHVNVCEHCHRGDVVPDIAHSIEEALRRGWIMEVDQ